MKRIRQQGFTLVELLVVIAVTGVLTVIIMTFMVNTMATSAQESAREDLLMQAQTALDTAGNDILQSAGADTTNRYPDEHAPGGSTEPLSWHSDSNTLVLATAVTDTHNQIIFDDPLHYVTAKNNLIYFVHDRTLYRRILAEAVSGNARTTSCPVGQSSGNCPADATLAQNVTDFTVSYYDADGQATTDPSAARGVQLSIKLSTVKYNKTISVQYASRTVFRND